MTENGENPQSSGLEGAVTRFIRFLFPRDPSKPPPKLPEWSRFYQRREAPFGFRVVIIIIAFGLMIYAAYLQTHHPGR